MRREDALKLIGTRVLAWTAANGEYVGTLSEVVPRRPWRGRVLIDGVVRPATPWEVGRLRQRRGFRVGETIEVGGTSIRPAPAEVVAGSYRQALERELARFREMRRTCGPADHWWLDKSLAELKRLAAAEPD